MAMVIHQAISVDDPVEPVGSFKKEIKETLPFIRGAVDIASLVTPRSNVIQRVWELYSFRPYHA